MESKIVPNIFYQSTFDKWPIEDSSVQAIITSPPYYSLRKYDIPDITIGKWKGQYGLEPSYQMYIENTLLWCKEAMRVLKKDGIFFLNLGDTWASKGKTGGDFSPYGKLSKSYSGRCRQNDYPAKSKLLMPHRVAIGLIDNNWILRNDIVWYKPNAMPESCKDRFSKKFEYIFIFSKNENYKFNLDSIRESHSEVSLNRVKHPWKSNHPSIGKIDTAKMGDRFCNPKGKNPGDMWSITTQPSKEEHYAMWPEKLVERMILCSTDEGDIVLDPFCGSGRTVEVSSNMKRVGLGIDLGYEVISKKEISCLILDISIIRRDMEKNNFKEEYRRLHEACPKCGSLKYVSTLMAYIYRGCKSGEYKDMNECVCGICKDKHFFHDRVVKL